MRNIVASVWLRAWRFLCQEWLWIGGVICVVSGVVLLNLLGADPRFHAVWLYTPQAIPTLAFVDSILHDQRVLVPGNHATWLVVWMLHHVFANPVTIVIGLYVIATVATSVCAYVMFRLNHITMPWAVVGAIAFGLLPARFEMANLTMHWWVSLPIVMVWGLSWWDGVRIDPKKLNPREWVLVGMTAFILCMFGFTLWAWSSIVLLTCAMIAGVTYRTWRPAIIAGGMAGAAWVFLLCMQQIWPIPEIRSDDGLRLSTLWVPHADHRIPWFAQHGFDFDTLDVIHTDATYIGIVALAGLGVMVGHTLIRSVHTGPVSVVSRLMVVLGVIVIMANQRGLLLLLQFAGMPPMSTMYVDIWIAFIGIIALLTVLQSVTMHRYTIVVAVGICMVLLVDHVPTTNVLYQMMRRQVDIPVTSTWRDGIWFGQATQAQDVVSITGVGDIEPGYGRWSDASKADYVEITLDKPISAPVSLVIRARGVGVNIGSPVVVQIGSEQQSMVLTGVVEEYQVTFANANGNTIRVVPQPVTEPPSGDTRRIGVLLQSIRVMNP